MKRAAETAARIASGGRQVEPVRIEPIDVFDRYALNQATLFEPGTVKKALLEHAAKHALSFDARIEKAQASFSEELREILVITSEGRWAHDLQPMMRFGVSVVAQSGPKRESGRSGGGGRVTLGYFEGKSPEFHAEVAAQQALVLLDARPAPAGQLEVILAPGDSGILLHEAVGHGLEADFNRKPGFWDPVVGLGYHRLGNVFDVHGVFETGGFGVGSDIEVNGSLRFDFKFARHFGLTFGYNLLYFKVSDDENLVRPFEVKQTLHGPVFGFGLYF
jgi:hypothetical protein